MYRLGALSGLAFSILFGAGSALWVFSQPARGADTAEILAFFEGAATRILVGGTMSLIAIVALVWFGAYLFERLRRTAVPGARPLALVAFSGAVLAAAVGLAAETINMAGAMSARDGQLSGATAQVYFDLTYAFGAHAAGPAFALIALPIGLAGLGDHDLLPRGGTSTSFVLGAALLTPAILFRPAFLALYTATVLLIALLSVYLYREQIPKRLDA